MRVLPRAPVFCFFRTLTVGFFLLPLGAAVVGTGLSRVLNPYVSPDPRLTVAFFVVTGLLLAAGLTYLWLLNRLLKSQRLTLYVENGVLEAFDDDEKLTIQLPKSRARTTEGIPGFRVARAQGASGRYLIDLDYLVDLNRRRVRIP